MAPLLIVGIDPGSRITGFGAVMQEGRRVQRVDSGRILLDENQPMSVRLATLFRELHTLLKRLSPAVVAVEDLFAARNARSALLLGQARGVVLAAAGLLELPVQAYAPALVKRAVSGHGRATKDQVQRMVQVLLGLPQVVPSDEADALAVAICHALMQRGTRAAAVLQHAPKPRGADGEP